MDASHRPARVLLEYLHIGYPIFLLVVFIAAFIASSIIAAKNVGKNGNQINYGPGGRPLPKRSRSTMAVAKPLQTYSHNTMLVFKWLSVAVLVTFIADAAINIAHTVLARSEHWWCGQSLVVRYPPSSLELRRLILLPVDLHRGILLRPCCHPRVIAGYQSLPDLHPVCPMVGGHTD